MHMEHSTIQGHLTADCFWTKALSAIKTFSCLICHVQDVNIDQLYI